MHTREKHCKNTEREEGEESKEEKEREPMGMSLAQAVAALMGRCARGLSRAAHRLRRPGLTAPSFSSRAIVPFLGGGGSIKRVLSSKTSKRRKVAAAEEWRNLESADGVWRKEILMGERCQPLEFSGAIFYDAEGRRLAAPPRTPLRSPLPASIKLAANA